MDKPMKKYFMACHKNGAPWNDVTCDDCALPPKVKTKNCPRDYYLWPETGTTDDSRFQKTGRRANAECCAACYKKYRYRDSDSEAVPTGSTKSKSRSKLCVIDAPISISISIFSAYANETSHIDDYQQGEHFFRSRFRSR